MATDVGLPPRYPVVGVLASATTYAEATRCILDAARARQSMVLAATSVHGVTLAARDRSLRDALNSFDIVAPDGQPVRWALNLLHGASLVDRVYGPTLTLHVCAAAAEQGLSVYFYGSTPTVLDRMCERLRAQFPTLEIAGTYSPPFRPANFEEDAADARRIRDSGASIVFVGLGCPRQERWAARQRLHLELPLICVGAAFDFHAGSLRQAPELLQKNGLEWAFRLAMEPRRLWKRYAQAVPLFVLLLARQYLTTRFRGVAN